jgi:phage-related protein
MPTIKDKLYFNLDGVWSSEYGLVHVVLDGGMYEENLGANREINEKKVRNNPKPLLNGVEESPIEFEMSIAFKDDYTDELLDQVIRWLFKDYYRPLYFQGAENKVFRAMVVGQPQIVHNGLQQGYVNLSIRCDSSNVYSPTNITPMYTVSGTKTITMNSTGHVDIYPEISILKIGNGTLKIESLDDMGNTFLINNLTNGEDLYLNCQREIITTDAIGVYHFDDVVGEYPRLIYGANRFKITGDCKIQFRYIDKYRF